MPNGLFHDAFFKERGWSKLSEIMTKPHFETFPCIALQVSGTGIQAQKNPAQCAFLDMLDLTSCVTGNRTLPAFCVRLDSLKFHVALDISRHLLSSAA